MAKEMNFNANNEEVNEEKIENPNPTESKKVKVWKIVKAAAYGVAFIAGAGVVFVLSHLGDKDDEKEEEKSDLDLDDITDSFVDAAKEDPSIETTVF